jgi:hypothetical protein
MSKKKEQWTTATGFVASTSRSVKFYKKRTFLAKMRKQKGSAKQNMVSLVSGRSIAALMTPIFKGNSVPDEWLGTLEEHKATRMCEFVQRMYPKEDGWTITSELTIHDHLHRRKARLDVIAKHEDSQTHAIVECKTGRDTEADHTRTYKKPSKILEVDYIEHQKQLVFQMKVAEAVNKATGSGGVTIDGHVLYAGGDTPATTFLKLYKVDPTLNNDAFVGLSTPADTTAVLDNLAMFRRSDVEIEEVIGDEAVRQVVPLQAGPEARPSHCILTDSGRVVGYYAYLRSTPAISDVGQALGIVSPCAERIVVLVD